MSGLDELSQEGSPELLSDVMTKLIKDSNSSFIIGSLGEDETAAAAPPPGNKQPPLDLHTLWKLLEKMDMENGGSGAGEGAGVGISAVGSDTDNLDSHSGGSGGKMSTWGETLFLKFLLDVLDNLLQVQALLLDNLLPEKLSF